MRQLPVDNTNDIYSHAKHNVFALRVTIQYAVSVVHIQKPTGSQELENLAPSPSPPPPFLLSLGICTAQEESSVHCVTG